MQIGKLGLRSEQRNAAPPTCTAAVLSRLTAEVRGCPSPVTFASRKLAPPGLPCTMGNTFEQGTVT